MSWPSAYLKMKVLGAIEYAQGKSIQQRIKRVSEMTFMDEDGKSKKFTHRTISTWYYRYKNHGVTGITNKQRADKGTTRKISPEELLEAINQVMPYFRSKKRFNKMDIYRHCIEKGIIHQSQLSQTHFYRLIQKYELLKDNIENNKKRLAFAMQYANQLWQADTMYGPFVHAPRGKKAQTKLIAFIDDASRVLCHGQFFFTENTDNLIEAVKTAFYKRGIPEQLYCDHGSIYTSAEITMICARIGCILRHAPVRDGAAKGKIERFFRRVRDQFLIRNLDLSSLDALNKQFTQWVEEKYNNSIHSAIGMKPIDRFAMDMKRIKYLEPNRVTEELFYYEEDRTVKKDNTFSLKNIRYETPADLRNKKIQIRYNRNKIETITVYYKNNRMGEAKKLDLIANGRLHRGGKK